MLCRGPHQLRWPPLLCAAALVAAAVADATTATAPKVLPTCVVSVGAQSFNLAELGSPAVYHRSHEASSKGWGYSFSACGDVPLRSISDGCGSKPRCAALQETHGACYSLGTFATRNVSATASGVSIAFSGGDGGRSTVVAVECADIPRRLVLGWGYGSAPGSHTALVRARAGCALECARDPITGAVCGGLTRGTCVVSATPDHTATCACRSGYAGPLCLSEPPTNQPALLYISALLLLPAAFPSHALIAAAALLVFSCVLYAWLGLMGGVCSIQRVQRSSRVCVLVFGVFSLTTVQQPPVLLFSASTSPHQQRVAPSRWRGNYYVRDDGILPYQLCGADLGVPGPKRSTATFLHGGRSYAAVLTAASVWGESLPSGQPLRADALELLVYFSEANQPCKLEMYIHCSIPSVQPAIACSFDGSSWRNGSMTSGTFVAVVRCPLDFNSFLPDASDVEIALGDRAVTLLQTAPSLADASSSKEGILTASICYEHVAAADDLVICTQPHYFDESSTFWQGSPPYMGGATLLEAFLLHNLYVVNASRLVMHDLSSNLHARMKPFLDTGRVKYRTNWALNDELPGVGVEFPFYAFEANAEATCSWEHRISARWVQILHAVDNFLMPTCFGCNVTSMLSRVNHTSVSELSVPMVEANTPGLQSAEFRTQNVLQRFSLLAEDWVGRGRETPIGNPRHFNEALIHNFAFPRIAGLGVMGGAECIELGLQTVHIMALARPQLDTHDGLSDTAYTELGLRLAAQLSKWERNSRWDT